MPHWPLPLASADLFWSVRNCIVIDKPKKMLQTFNDFYFIYFFVLAPLSAHVKRFSVSRMWDLFWKFLTMFCVLYFFWFLGSDVVNHTTVNSGGV